ncbi:hypothetical protein VM98_38885, partial [Streptomyces rubellomurinus subsp. indigoferus]
GVRGAQAGGALLAVATTGVLLAAGGRQRRRAALGGWFPGVTGWAVNHAHVATLGALLMADGLACAARRPAGPGGALRGAAVATQLPPPRRRPGARSRLFAR